MQEEMSALYVTVVFALLLANAMLSIQIFAIKMETSSGFGDMGNTRSKVHVGLEEQPGEHNAFSNICW